jgi:phenylalanyl-tRNA synthetase beta chain
VRVPLSWLKDYVALDVEPTDRDAVRALGRVFDGLGLVVEGIETIGGGLGGVILARVVEIAPIEGADKIRLATVDFAATDPIAVVCGASNYGIGDVVPFAPIGVTLPNGMKIAARKMRGVTSNGMLCSANELGLRDDHEGLMIIAKTGSSHGALPVGCKLGMELTDYLGIFADVVYDIAIEPNRPDALSMVGIARDVAAAVGKPLVVPHPVFAEGTTSVEELASIKVVDTEHCPRLVARVLSDVQAIDSPPEIARRLTLAGMRPINAVVDASNYVMLELGQPTHPYDLAHLYGRGLRVRTAKHNETLVTLDGKRRTVGQNGDEDLLICDNNDVPVGLAGIMGGESSEISPLTTEVLLEVAYFTSIGIGKTANAQGLRSEASNRFWRGTDPDGLELSADRFCDLVIKAHIAAGVTPPVIAKGRLSSAPPLLATRQIMLSPTQVNTYLGTSLSTETMCALLLPLGFIATPVLEMLSVQVPSYRSDVTREVDLIEEVARHFGYDKIASTSRRSPFVGRRTLVQELRRDLRRIISGIGIHEAWTSSIVDPTEDKAIGSLVMPVELANPIVINEFSLRTHLIGGLCAALRYNESHRNAELRLFEIGNVFAASETEDERPVERELLGVLFAQHGDDAKTARNAWQAIVDGLGLERTQFDLDQPAPGEFLMIDWLSAGVHPTRSGRVRVGDETIAVIGEIDPLAQEIFNLSNRRLGWLVVDVGLLALCSQRTSQAQPVSHFPSADVDLAFVLPETVPAYVLEDAIRHAAGELGESVRLVDTYRGRGVDEGSRSLSYRVRFCAADRTLGDRDISDARAQIITTVETTLPAMLRS